MRVPWPAARTMAANASLMDPPARSSHDGRDLSLTRQIARDLGERREIVHVALHRGHLDVQETSTRALPQSIRLEPIGDGAGARIVQSAAQARDHPGGVS